MLDIELCFVAYLSLILNAFVETPIKGTLNEKCKIRTCECDENNPNGMMHELQDEN